MDVRLPAEPRHLALGEATSRSDGVLDCLVEDGLSPEVLGELAVADRLERWQVEVPTGLQKTLHLAHPPGSEHGVHPARDAIVQDGSRQRQTDADRPQGFAGERRLGDPGALRAAGPEGHLEPAQRSLGVPGGGASGGSGIEEGEPPPQPR